MENFQVTLYTPFNKLTSIEGEEVVQFLYEHLDQYGDAKSDIKRAIDYAMKEIPSPGGFVLVGREKGRVLGTVVINKTGMSGYIPENILVYIAVHEDTRGKGVGKRMMKEAINNCHGNVALHVEADNPALFLYEKLGFENKYLEMRLNKAKFNEKTGAANKNEGRSKSAVTADQNH